MASPILGAKDDPNKNEATVDEGEALGTHRPRSPMRGSALKRVSLQREKSSWLRSPCETLSDRYVDRLVELERTVRALRADRSLSPLAQDDDDASVDIPLIPDIKELGWAELCPS